jgi:hypothetical protein
VAFFQDLSKANSAASEAVSHQVKAECHQVRANDQYKMIRAKKPGANPTTFEFTRTTASPVL